MKRLVFWSLVSLLVSGLFLQVWAMRVPAVKGKRTGEVKHLSAFNLSSPSKFFSSGKPKKTIDLSQIYFRKPALKGFQKQALRQAAAEVPGLEIYFDPRTGLPLFIKGRPLFRPTNQGLKALKPKPEETALAALEHFRALLRLEHPSQEFTLRAKSKDMKGRFHLRLSQRWQGIRYFGKELLVHLDETGQVYLIEGRYAETPKALEITPQVEVVEAVQKAVTDLGTDPSSVFLTELVIKEDAAGIPHLAWQVDLSHGAETWRYFIDAKIGQILEKYRLSYDLSVPGSGRDEQNGELRQFHVWQEGGRYFFIDTTLPFHSRDPSVTLEDFGAGNIAILWLPYGDPALGLAWLVSNDPNDWPAAAVSVWYGLRQTLEYYYRTFGRAGLNGGGATTVGVIGLPEANAFYDGGQQDFMYFGTGDGYQMGPLTALDVVAHEFTHGVTNYTARLEYRFQSGALNEAFSDIFAAMVDREDWLIGEDVVLVPPYNLRNLEDPHQSFQPLPAHMNEYRDLPLDDDNGGVHINATIPAHTAYLVAQVIGREKTEQIFYKTLAEHLTPESDFLDFCRALAQSAEELYGADSQEEQTVISACNQVGIVEGEVPGGGGEAPPEIPPVETDDFLLFVFMELDPWTSEPIYHLGERMPNGELYYVTERSIHPTRPAPFYHYGPHYVLFIDSNYNLWAANIISETYEEELINDSGEIWSVATSPASPWVVYTSVDENDKHLYAWNPDTNETKSFAINFQPPDATAPITTYFPDVVSFSADGQTVFFDCYNRIRFQSQEYEFWALGRLDFVHGTTSLVFPVPERGYHVGNPATAKTKPYLLAYDLWHGSTVETRILNLRSGQSGLVWQGRREEGLGTSGWPNFTGDDAYLVLQDWRPETAEVIVAVPIRQQGEIWVGDQSNKVDLLFDEQGLGILLPVVYRPGGVRVSPEARVSPTSLSFGQVKVGQEKLLSIRLENVGNYPLEFLGSEIEGTSVFRSQAIHTEIAPGESYQIRVFFAPKAATFYQASLKLYTSDPQHPEIQVSLSGQGVSGGVAPMIDVRVNGSEGPLSLYRDDILKVTISLNTGGISGRGDYFLWAQIPSGACYCFNYPEQWRPCACNNPTPAYQGNLVFLNNLLVYQSLCAMLPSGEYTLWFAVDTQMNGVLDSDATRDGVRFSIR